MNNPFEWDMTIALAVMGLIYGCLLGIVGRAQGVKLSKLGLVVGTVSTIVLASMAFVGPMGTEKIGGSVIMAEIEETKAPERNLLLKKLRLTYFKTLREHGPRPTKNHVAYEDENGKFQWILKDNYIKILVKQYKEKKEKAE